MDKWKCNIDTEDEPKEVGEYEFHGVTWEISSDNDNLHWNGTNNKNNSEKKTNPNFVRTFPLQLMELD